jgi:hypothetical protein
MSTSTPSTPSASPAVSTHKSGENVFDWLSSLDSLEKAREEIALKLHLASMDAKSDWEKLEKSIHEPLSFLESPFGLRETRNRPSAPRKGQRLRRQPEVLSFHRSFVPPSI